MGRQIKDYDKDLSISRDDKLIGTEQSSGTTYNYRIGSILDIQSATFQSVPITYEFRNDGTDVSVSNGVMTTDSDSMSAVTTINLNRYNQLDEDIRPLLDAVNANLVTVSAYINIKNSSTNENFCRLEVTAIVDNTTHYTLTVAVVGSYYSGSFTNEAIYFGAFDLSQSASATAWEDLTNTPSSFAGQAGKFPTVKGTEDGIEFTAISVSGYVTITWENLVASGARATGDLYDIQGSNDPADDYGKVTLVTPDEFFFTDPTTKLTALITIV